MNSENDWSPSGPSPYLNRFHRPGPRKRRESIGPVRPADHLLTSAVAMTIRDENGIAISDLDVFDRPRLPNIRMPGSPP
jgi:hypothetical protein